MAVVGEGSLVYSWAYTPLNLVANRPYTLCQTLPALHPIYLFGDLLGLFWDQNSPNVMLKGLLHSP